MQFDALDALAQLKAAFPNRGVEVVIRDHERGPHVFLCAGALYTGFFPTDGGALPEALTALKRNVDYVDAGERQCKLCQ